MRLLSMQRIFTAIFALAFFALPSLGASAASAPERIIIDTDPGTDDALAILLALNSPEVRVEALTIVAGNVTASVGLDNALKVARSQDAAIFPSPRVPRARFTGASMSSLTGTAPTVSAASNFLLRAATPIRASALT